MATVDFSISDADERYQRPDGADDPMKISRTEDNSMQMRWLACSLVLAGVLTGCGSSPQKEPPPAKKLVSKFVYVANYGSASLSAFTVNADTGALAAIPGSPFATGGGPFSLTLDHSAKFLYVVNHGSWQIAVYRISTSGSLSEIPGSPVATQPNPNGAAIDPSGKFLYVPTADAPAGGSNVGQIWRYSIDSTTGALDPVTATAFPAGALPTWLTFDRSGNFLYASDIDAGEVLGFSLDHTNGDLNPVAGSPFAAGVFPTSITANPKTDVVYVACEGDDAVLAFQVDPATGVLTTVAGSPFLVGSVPLFTAADPSGKLVFVSNAFSSDISAFEADSTTNRLVPVTGSPFPNGASPIAVGVDPTGNFLYVTDSDSSILSYRILPGGGLSRLGGSFQAGTEPRAIVVVGASE
jgi:6-phosphogluconolactonase